MAENTSIEWCDSTWSPWEGCTKVSPGCDHCYAARMNGWLKAGNNWGPGAPRLIYSEEHWDKPIKWQRAAPKFHTLHGRNRRVFPSVCDPFDKEAPGLQRERLFATIRVTPQLDWLLLTKRIGNAKSMLPADWGDGYPNVWIGATIVNQEEADRDMDKLDEVPAAVRFLSMEPLLGPVDLGFERLWGTGGRNGIDWVIVGGESGPGARPMNPAWARSLRDQCIKAGVPFLFKQWGEWGPASDFEPYPGRAKAQTAQVFIETGRDGLRREGATVIHFGKKTAGRVLDGMTHDGFPSSA